jgi:hypothetical protein
VAKLSQIAPALHSSKIWHAGSMKINREDLSHAGQGQKEEKIFVDQV